MWEQCWVSGRLQSRVEESLLWLFERTRTAVDDDEKSTESMEYLRAFCNFNPGKPLLEEGLDVNQLRAESLEPAL